MPVWCFGLSRRRGQSVNRQARRRTIDKFSLTNLTIGKSFVDWLSIGFRPKRPGQGIILSETSRTVLDNPGQSGTILDCPGLSALEENRIEENRSICDSAAGAADHSADDIQGIWRHYREYHPGTAKALKSNRKEYQLIRARLGDFDAETLKKAIDGYHRSAFHCGDNPQGKQYQSLALIMRDISHVQQGIEFLTAKASDNGRPKALDPVESLGDTRD